MKWNLCALLLASFVLVAVCFENDANSTYKITEFMDHCGETVLTDGKPAGKLEYSNSRPGECGIELRKADAEAGETFQILFVDDDTKCPNQVYVYDGNTTSDNILRSCDDRADTFKSTSTVLYFLGVQSGRRRSSVTVTWTIVTTGQNCNTSLDTNAFLCADGTTCIDKSLVCDETSNCPDESDEKPDWAGCSPREQPQKLEVWMIVAAVLGALCVTCVIAVGLVCAFKRKDYNAISS